LILDIPYLTYSDIEAERRGNKSLNKTNSITGRLKQSAVIAPHGEPIQKWGI